MVLRADDEFALSLYFGLEGDEKIDLAVAAEAALHWVASLRAAATALIPHANISVQLIDAEEGSLRFNGLPPYVSPPAALELGGQGRPSGSTGTQVEARAGWARQDRFGGRRSVARRAVWRTVL